MDRVGLSMGELRALDASVWTPAPLWFLASCLLLLVGYLVSAALWGRMVEDLGGPAMPVADSVRLFMVANLGRYLPGKVWQIAGLAVLASRRGVPKATATGAALMGQALALVAATLVGVGALLGGPADVRRWGLPGAAVVVLGTLVFLLPPVFRWSMALWFRLARQDPPPGLGSVHAVRWLALFTANWALYAFSFWVLAVSFGHTGNVIPVASAFAAAYVLGYLALFAPAGVGVREGFLVVFLAPYLGVGPAGALAVVARLWTTVVELIPAATFGLRYLAPRRGDANEGEDAGE